MRTRHGRCGRPRRLTASNTLTVPSTLTRAPSGGSARQNGTCSAARWITRVDAALVEHALERRQVGDVACTRRTAAISSGDMTNRQRWGSAPTSSAVTAAPSATSWRTTQVPMHPNAPVTRNRSHRLMTGQTLSYCRRGWLG